MQILDGYGEVSLCLQLVRRCDLLYHSNQWLQAFSFFRNLPGLMHM